MRLWISEFRKLDYGTQVVNDDSPLVSITAKYLSNTIFINCCKLNYILVLSWGIFFSILATILK